MNSKLVLCAVALALGAPVAANAQTQSGQTHPAAATAGAAKAAPGEVAAGQPGEALWLRERVEQLEAALAKGDNCTAKHGSHRKSGASSMKSASKKAGKASSSMGSSMGMEEAHDKMPMPMESEDDKMDGAMQDPPSAKPADPAPMQPDPPAAPPAPTPHM